MSSSIDRRLRPWSSIFGGRSRSITAFPTTPGACASCPGQLHKFLFETIALKVYVLGHTEPVDLFDTAFDHVRTWVRRGEPQGPARPWLWQFPSQDLLQSWYVEPLHRVGGRAIARARVFGNWFLADLTSDHRDVPASLPDIEPAPDIFCIADTIELTGR